MHGSPVAIVPLGGVTQPGLAFNVRF
jgi:hypothetical protein